MADEFQWLISVPVWGEPYLTIFLLCTLPAIERAIALYGGDVTLVAHTNNEGRDRIRAQTQLRQISTPALEQPEAPNPFTTLSACHRAVMTGAQPGTRVILMTADMVISEGSLAYCSEVFKSNKRLVGVAGMRTIWDGIGPNLPRSRDLLSWGWDHKHAITIDSIYPNGCSQDISRMYFEKDGTVVSRQLLPHPFALAIDGRQLHFEPTVDANLIQSFYDHEVFIVTDPDELAVVEMSVPDKAFHRVNSMETRLEHHQIIVVNPMQRHCLQHRITLKGRTGQDVGDEDVIKQVLRTSLEQGYAL